MADRNPEVPRRVRIVDLVNLIGSITSITGVTALWLGEKFGDSADLVVLLPMIGIWTLVWFTAVFAMTGALFALDAIIFSKATRERFAETFGATAVVLMRLTLWTGSLALIGMFAVWQGFQIYLKQYGPVHDALHPPAKTGSGLGGGTLLPPGDPCDNSALCQSGICKRGRCE